MESSGVKPKIKMVGEDGNIFSILGRAGKALKRNGQMDKAEELYKRFSDGEPEDYDHALAIILEYVRWE